jgi:hypothetical protein
VERFEPEIQSQQPQRAAVLHDPEVQRAAARFRITLDESLGDETPQWIRELAERPLPPRGR